MEKRTLQLLGTTIVLFFVSLGVFFNEHQRGSDLVAGSDFISGLDVSKISKIKVKSVDNELIFSKSGSVFVIENKKSYPASTEKINDLLFKISNIQIAEKVSSSESSHDEYQVSPENAEVTVSLYDKNENKILDFYVGRSFKGRRNYIRKSGSDDVYLSQRVVAFNTSKNEFIEKKILDVNSDEISKVETALGKEAVAVVKKGDGYEVSGMKTVKIDQQKVKDFIKEAGGVEFLEYLGPDEEKVKNLKFTEEARIELKNQLTYQFQFAQQGDKYYLKARTLTEQMPEQMVIDQNAGKEELSKVDSMLKLQERAQQFNAYHGRWVYEISKSNYQKYAKGPGDFAKL